MKWDVSMWFSETSSGGSCYSIHLDGGSIFMTNWHGLIICMLTWHHVVPLAHFLTSIFRITQVPSSALNNIPRGWNICRGPSVGCLQVRLEPSLDCREVQAVAGMFFLP